MHVRIRDEERRALLLAAQVRRHIVGNYYDDDPYCLKCQETVSGPRDCACYDLDEDAARRNFDDIIRRLGDGQPGEAVVRRHRLKPGVDAWAEFQRQVEALGLERRCFWLPDDVVGPVTTADEVRRVLDEDALRSLRCEIAEFGSKPQ